MIKGFFNVPTPTNEPVYSYAVGTKERKLLKAAIDEARAKQIDVPMYIGGEEVRTENKVSINPPHDHQHLLGHYNQGTKNHVTDAINAALAAKSDWENLPWEDRAAIFLKAAELASTKYRYKLNAATMLAQSKNPYQAEIDSACEFTDFLRFNVQYMTEIYAQQPPVSGKGVWNRLEQRPLEGFVFALTPFNFTAIAGNLPSCVAMMGNVVVWKPSNAQIYSAQVLMEIFIEAGLPAGVINLVYVSGPDAGEVIFKHPDFAGIHFTGSTGVFQDIWKTIGENIHRYKTYPRIVGETGGKDFIVVHPSADLQVTNTALVRGAFEYQGQKCSAASRAYVPASMWPALKDAMTADVNSLKIGGTEDFTNFINAVIDEKSFDKLAKYIDRAKASDDAEVVIGGTYDKSKGYFVSPTVILAKKSDYETMSEELFGPVLTIFVYEDDKWEETLEIVDKTSIYALTGSVIAKDRYAIAQATHALRNAAGNFYVNDKCTGAVVGQQPFGGARGSGTNDKAGSMINLLRWVSPRTIKETFNPDTNYKYPFLEEGE
ncbi:L-glutamate gamma-semialdehyde dehydrogenase [Sphingobacterium faecium]|jgi:1-pyrroline-5-carboxylate dehydrogenase|uniref:L-glutamate gamma-semialdehyde dehydrogenase n=1 Tax=Sphingobacterium faecium TaxID=34087 RepID=UPI00097F2D49|nr:L-glutamate gamma-semialdehyde dehydrogenase [Sphingobacterium faecium]WGQ16462.1 L-glutamate gamma-semialdehyde dehydrogenase [Sphingobacterium faecium]SJN23510.1 Delta-1-pyrroline-5-carboxylate dehydrogenase [Sphingobacterium faecium PCAi_F2.5]HCU43812.1 1-pyrroline-5-carboxylate dehydrogenase [Sphingobacterium sp.]